MIARLFDMLIERPRRIIAVAFLLALVGLVLLFEWPSLNLALEVDPSVRALLPQQGVELELFEAVRDRYSSDDLLLVAWVADDLFTPTRLAALKRLTRRVERMPGVEHVESLATAVRTHVYEDYTEVGAYLSEVPETEAEALEVRDQVPT